MNTTEVVTLRLSPTVVEALDRRAGSEMRSRANLARFLIVRGLGEAETDEED